MKKISGNIVDVENKKMFFGSLTISDEGRIVEIKNIGDVDKTSNYIIPGFIDAHVHIESSMLTPQNFSRLSVMHGCVAVVTDPHEIANVLGVEGINFMYDDAAKALNKIFFCVPSCVPATSFDFSGSVVTAKDVESLFESGKFIGLSEVMNVPGVLFGDDEVLNKINSAKKRNLPVDGHAPLLKGSDLKKYIESGISTDHECMTFEEAKLKIEDGMDILIREGSAAKNYSALSELIKTYSEHLMFCTDDSHPDDLLYNGEIDKIVKRAIADGYDLYDVLRIASLNPVKHYNLNVGLLKIGDFADFIVVDDLKTFNTSQTYINGNLVFDRQKKDVVSNIKSSIVNNFERNKISQAEISFYPKYTKLNVIKVIDGELFTPLMEYNTEIIKSNVESFVDDDVLKLVYLNRYNKDSKPQVGFVNGFNIKNGALASSISHDSHNILAVGSSDKYITQAINSIVENKGGIVVVNDKEIMTLPLPIAGIISDKDGVFVAEVYKKLNEMVKNMSSSLTSPFMTLSFLSLLVIPEVKLGEKGLFSYSKFSFID